MQGTSCLVCRKTIDDKLDDLSRFREHTMRGEFIDFW